MTLTQGSSKLVFCCTAKATIAFNAIYFNITAQTRGYQVSQAAVCVCVCVCVIGVMEVASLKAARCRFLF